MPHPDVKAFAWVLGAVATVVAGTVGTLTYLDSKHAHRHELTALKVEMVQQELKQLRRIKVSESTNYAQILVKYNNIRKERPLTGAEIARVQTAERELLRINRELAEE